MTKERIYDCVTIIIVAILLMLSMLSYGQSEPTVKPTLDLQTFSAKQYGNKSYINWTVLSTDSNYYFVLEKAIDTLEFKTISVLKGYASPEESPLLFSFIDESVNKNVRYRLRAYRIRYEAVGGEVIQVFSRNEVDLFEMSNLAVASLMNMNKAFVSVKLF